MGSDATVASNESQASVTAHSLEKVGKRVSIEVGARTRSAMLRPMSMASGTTSASLNASAALQRSRESGHSCSSEVSHVRTPKSVSGMRRQGRDGTSAGQEAAPAYGTMASGMGCSRGAKRESSVIRAKGA